MVAMAGILLVILLFLNHSGIPSGLLYNSEGSIQEEPIEKDQNSNIGRFNDGSIHYDENKQIEVQLWQTVRSRPLGQEAAATRVTWLEHNPSMTMVLYDDNDVDRFFKQFLDDEGYSSYASFPLGMFLVWPLTLTLNEGW